MRISARLAHTIAAATAIVLAIIYRFAPGEGSFYPSCIFARLTGWECPGCGSTRALYAMLHLHFTEALALNPLFTLAFPVVMMAAVVQYFVVIRSGRTLEMRLPRDAYPALLVICLAFGILRNMSIGGLR